MAEQPLPHWQLDTIYSGFDDEEYAADKRRLREGIVALEHFLDGAGADEEPAVFIGKGLERIEAALVPFATLSGYLYLRIAVDATDDAAKAERSALAAYGIRLQTLRKRFTAWLSDVNLAEAQAASDAVASHLHFLEREQHHATHLLSPEGEAVAISLDDTGGAAWSRLYGQLIARRTIKAKVLDEEGAEGEYSVAQLKVLQTHENVEVRRRAFETELELLARDEVAYAAAMNSIKGQVDSLARRRGWESAFDEALFDNGLTKPTLAAMHQACEESFDALRDYLKAKAWHLGKQQLAWYDLFAPLPKARAPRFTWEQAKTLVEERFGSYGPELAGFAKRTFLEGWIDVPPRKGKVNGAFCSAVAARGESRVMLNFGGSLGDVFTLAHELGHAYHNDCKYRFGRDVIQAITPNTLSETASIFCETIMLDGLLATDSDLEKLAVLEHHLQQSTQLVIDIHSRYLFEATVFERRRERELSVSELNEIMLEAQAQTYGDGLAEGERHPLMWAHKGHYYSSGRSFYNYPYTFGFLFGLGLYAEYQKDQQAFMARYDELLASTGMFSATALAQRFGIDIEDVRFWRNSLAVITGRVRVFKELTERVTA